MKKRKIKVEFECEVAETNNELIVYLPNFEKIKEAILDFET